MEVQEWLGRVPERWRRPKVVVGVGAAVAVMAVAIAVALFALRTPTGPAPQLTLPRAGDAPAAASPAGSVSAPGTTAALVTVHVAGAVASPGVYSVPTGARVADAVTAAGGPVAEAALDQVNLAAKVGDGDRVYLPRKGEAVPGGAVDSGAAKASGPAGATAPTGPLDLNTATVEQLDTLPGVGPATAQAIVTYRTRHGRFRSVTELLEVPGIGPAKLEAVRDLVRV